MDNIILKLMNAEKWSEISEQDKVQICQMNSENHLSEEQYGKYYRLIAQDDWINSPKHNLTVEEEAYRRGYAHGVSIALMGKVTNEDVRKWRQEKRLTGAPGTYQENVYFKGEALRSIICNFESFVSA